MLRSKFFWLVVGVFVAVYGFRYLQLTLFGPSDKDQIVAALNRSLDAGRKGEDGGVLEYLSGDFKINAEVPASKGQIANYIRQSKPDVTVTGPVAPTVSDQTATVTVPMHVKTTIMSMPIDQTLNDVTITFQKETDMDWGVIPVSKWRIKSVYLPAGFDLERFGGG